MTLRGTPGAQRGNYAYAYVGKNGPGAGAYCTPTKAHAVAGARGLESIAICTAVAKGANCADAKKAAKRAATAKCKPCRFFDVDYRTGREDKWAVVERTPKGRVFVGLFDRGRAAMEEVDRLARLHCPRGLTPTAEESALSGLRRRR